MDDRLVWEWVPDELWALAKLLIAAQRARPQDGDTARVDPRAVLTAIVYVLQTGVPGGPCRQGSGFEGDRAPPVGGLDPSWAVAAVRYRWGAEVPASVGSGCQ